MFFVEGVVEDLVDRIEDRGLLTMIESRKSRCVQNGHAEKRKEDEYETVLKNERKRICEGLLKYVNLKWKQRN